jgi:CubicO group peptidase (beta-lactamase class C family)
MQGPWYSNVRQQAEEAMAALGVPGLAIAYRCSEGPEKRLIIGADASGRSLEIDSLYPVASITKLATALVVLQFVDRGEIRLDDSLSSFLPVARASRPGVTIRRLLSHTSGLPYDIDMTWVRTAAKVHWNGFARECLETGLSETPGSRVQYSNVGYGLLALVVERLTGASFQSVLTALVLRPLGIEGYLGTEPPRAPMQMKDIRGEWAGTQYQPFTTAFWRSLGLPWGGLVTTIDGALALVRAFRAHPRSFLSAAVLTAAVSNQNGELAGGFAPPLVWSRCWWGLGPDLHDQKSPHWAPATSSRQTYGHSGATGALAYLDPTVDVAWAIIGTRTADNGWLVRWGPRIGAAIIESCVGDPEKQ